MVTATGTRPGCQGSSAQGLLTSLLASGRSCRSLLCSPRQNLLARIFQPGRKESEKNTCELSTPQPQQPNAFTSAHRDPTPALPSHHCPAAASAFRGSPEGLRPSGPGEAAPDSHRDPGTSGGGRPSRGLAHLAGPHQQHLRLQHGGRGRAAVGAAAVRGSPAGGWRRPLAAVSWRSSPCGGWLGPWGAPVPDLRRCEPGDRRFGVPRVGLWCPSLVWGGAVPAWSFAADLAAGSPWVNSAAISWNFLLSFLR